MTGLRIVGMVVAVVVGMALAAQARLNGELSDRIKTPSPPRCCRSSAAS